MSTTSLSGELETYYAKRFFLMTYGGDEIRAEYEWNYYQSDVYKKFIKSANKQNTTTRSYTDKRTKGWKYYLANKEAVRTKYEIKHPIPPQHKANKSGNKVTIARYSSLGTLS